MKSGLDFRAEWFQSEFTRQRGVFLSLIGAAGSGKSTIGARLLELFPSDLSLSVSVTSRTPRQGETPGKSYDFVSRGEFEKRIREGYFFEWEETHGNYYGTPQNTIDSVMNGSTDLLLDIDIRGAIHFKRSFPSEAVNVFLLPSSGAVLRDRLMKREKGNVEEVERRLQTAEREYVQLLQEGRNEGMVDYVIVNDDLDIAFHKVCSILLTERSRLARMSEDSLRGRMK
ncbi:MAG: guanylate kinase [Bdellovibrionales bacterium]|nr:guanylate kinase [Bdellovibrionales bacterium]